jgi:hypothetical protein
MFKKFLRAVLPLLAVVVVTVTTFGLQGVANASTNQTQLIPMYIYPTGTNLTAWHHVCDTASTFTSGNTSTIIADPANNGPTFTDTNYTGVIDYCADDNLNVVGYLDTNFGAIPESTLTTEIDNWVTYYPDVEGVFFDNVNASSTATCKATATTTETCQAYYTHLEADADSDITAVTAPWIVGNPGTAASTTSWHQNIFDMVNVFEGQNTTFATWTPPTWVQSDPQGTSVLVWGDSTYTTAQAKSVCDHQLAENMREGYTSNGGGSWNTDPTAFWDAYLGEGCS